MQLAKERQTEIDAKVAAFLAAGKKVFVAENTYKRREAHSVWRPDPVKAGNARKRAADKLAEAEQAMRDNVVLVTTCGPVRRNAGQLRDALRKIGHKMTTPAVEQMAARLGVRLADGGRN